MPPDMDRLASMAAKKGVMPSEPPGSYSSDGDAAEAAQAFLDAIDARDPQALLEAFRELKEYC